MWLTVWEASAFNPWEVAEVERLDFREDPPREPEGLAASTGRGVLGLGGSKCDAESRSSGLRPHCYSILCMADKHLDNAGTPITFLSERPHHIEGSPSTLLRTFPILIPLTRAGKGAGQSKG